MNEVSINKNMKLSEHLASPSEATLSQMSKLNGVRLTPHFTLGELTKSKHEEIYNIPSRVAIENLRRLCGWLEELRARYNERYVFCGMWNVALELCSLATEGTQECGVRNDEEPIIINSGYRSPELNRRVGGVSTSNHLTGCAVDIRVLGKEQLIRYACILVDISDETKQDFDELLIEQDSKGSIWLHFAVRPPTQRNRHKIEFM